MLIFARYLWFLRSGIYCTSWYHTGPRFSGLTGKATKIRLTPHQQSSTENLILTWINTLLRKSLQNLRKNYLCKYYYQNPNIIKFNELMSTHKKKILEKLSFLLLKYMMLSVLLILNPLSILLSLLMYVLSNTHIYLYMYLWPVCTNVNNYVIFIPRVPIYWSERIKLNLQIKKGLGWGFYRRKTIHQHLWNFLTFKKYDVHKLKHIVLSLSTKWENSDTWNSQK